MGYKRFCESAEEILDIAKKTGDYFKIKSLLSNMNDEYLKLDDTCENRKDIFFLRGQRGRMFD